MKKSILNLDGAQELSKKEQKNIGGGAVPAPSCKTIYLPPGAKCKVCGGVPTLYTNTPPC